MAWKERTVKGGRLTLISAFILAIGGLLGFRLGIWGFLLGFLGIGLGVIAALISVILSLVAVILTSKAGEKITGPMVTLVIGAALILFPVTQAIPAFSGQYPPMHDITTDVQNPPAFVDVVALRGAGSNSIDYGSKTLPGGERLGDLAGKPYAAVQLGAYPDIKPLQVAGEADKVFARAVKAVDDMGWEIVSVARGDGRIEATVTSLMMGFKDDVVIRVKGSGDTVTVDVRSSSRVGISDLGQNAKRIKAFLAKLEADIQ